MLGYQKRICTFVPMSYEIYAMSRIWDEDGYIYVE